MAFLDGVPLQSEEEVRPENTEALLESRHCSQILCYHVMVAHCCQGIAQGEGAWLSDCAEELGYYRLHLRGEMEAVKAYEGGPQLCQREREKVDERSLD